jgi:hypothetical protein
MNIDPTTRAIRDHLKILSSQVEALDDEITSRIDDLELPAKLMILTLLGSLCHGHSIALEALISTPTADTDTTTPDYHT